MKQIQSYVRMMIQIEQDEHWSVVIVTYHPSIPTTGVLLSVSPSHFSSFGSY